MFIDQLLVTLLAKLKRNQGPTIATVNILEKISDILAEKHLSKREIRMELLLTVQDLVNNTFEGDFNAETTIAHCENILKLLMVSPSDERKVHGAQPTTIKTEKQSPPEITHKLCGLMVKEIADAYTAKWKSERKAGNPGLRAKNSNASKKLLKSLPKHEEYILKTLQNRWIAFERKYERILDSQSMSVELQRIYESLGAAQVVLGIFKRENFTEKIVEIKDAEPNFFEALAQLELEIDKLRTVDELKTNLFKELEPLEIEIDKLETGVSKAGEEIKNVEPKADVFEAHEQQEVEIDKLETVVSMGDRECYINFGKIWKGDDSRWLSVKHNFVQSGFMMANELYVSLPIFRRKFVLGCGNFGTVEFALSKNFHGIALKRLTESGRIMVDGDGIRKCVEAVDRQLAKLTQINVLRMTAFHDMCGYLFLYTQLCDYNLDEYLRALKERTKMDNFGISSELKAFLIGQLLQGLCTLHTCKPPVVHGNLKPTNVLVDAGGTVKLTDFGVYKYLYADQSSISATDQLWWPKEIHSWFKLLKCYTCSTMSDVYTCALLMIYVYGEGQQPNVESLEIILKPIVSAEVYATLQRMLSIYPLQRPQINEVNIRPTLLEIDSMRPS